MVNLNDASKENSNLSYYGLFFGFLTLAFAIYLGEQNTFDKMAVVILLVASVAAFSVVVRAVLMQHKQDVPEPDNVISPLPVSEPTPMKALPRKTDIAKTKVSEITATLPAEGSEKKNHATDNPVVEKSLVRSPVVQKNESENTKLKALMNAPLGEILVAALLSNPDNLARIIVQAVTQATVSLPVTTSVSSSATSHATSPVLSSTIQSDPV